MIQGAMSSTPASSIIDTTVTASAPEYFLANPNTSLRVSILPSLVALPHLQAETVRRETFGLPF
jgi:hypothetical protein